MKLRYRAVHSRVYLEGVMAAIMGWTQCPHTCYHKRQQWLAGYKSESARKREPGKEKAAWQE